MKKLLMLTILCALTGCLTRSSAINNVHLGMAEPDVIKIMGKPQSRAESKDGSVRLYYSLIEGPGAVFPYTIVLVNGKVDAYGRDGAQNADHLGITPMPVMVPLVH